jgi:hypothetical protein
MIYQGSFDANQSHRRRLYFRIGSFATDLADLACRFTSAPLQKRALTRRLWLPR